MSLGNALAAYNKMLEHFGLTCADTIDVDDETADDETVDDTTVNND